MARKKKVDPIPGFPEKWKKKLIAGLSNQGLEDLIIDVDHIVDKQDMHNLIAKCNKEKSAAQKDMEEFEELNQAKQKVKDLKEPFKSVIDTQAAKIEYCLFVMEQRGWE